MALSISHVAAVAEPSAPVRAWAKVGGHIDKPEFWTRNFKNLGEFRVCYNSSRFGDVVGVNAQSKFTDVLVERPYDGPALSQGKRTEEPRASGGEKKKGARLSVEAAGKTYPNVRACFIALDVPMRERGKLRSSLRETRKAKWNAIDMRVI